MRGLAPRRPARHCTATLTGCLAPLPFFAAARSGARRGGRGRRLAAVQWEDPATALLTAERSRLINKEVRRAGLFSLSACH